MFRQLSTIQIYTERILYNISIGVGEKIFLLLS